LYCGGVDSVSSLTKLLRMTALQVIQRIKALPPRERRKVFKFVYAHESPNATTRRALREDLTRAKRFESAPAMMADLRR
jgi:hypothetical protein